MRHRLSLVTLCAVACGGDEAVLVAHDTGAADAIDAAAQDAAVDGGVDGPADAAVDARDTGRDLPREVAPPPRSVTFILSNQNPGGLSRWVEVQSPRGTPTWYAVRAEGSLDEYLRIHETCTVCACDDLDCTPCTPERQILELAAGEEIRATWDGSIVEIDQDLLCAEPAATSESRFTVELAWSQVPPDDSGALPAGTLSNTRVAFELTEAGGEVRYDIERSAE